MQARALRLLVLFAILFTPLRSVRAAGAAQAADNKATIDFPNTVTFAATLQASAAITSVTLEYGTDQSTCGKVIGKAFPDFNTGTSVQAEWTWDMRQSGSLPPGATIWWRWRYSDQTGKETVSEEKTITWLDGIHPWQTLTSGMLRLHWYGIDQAFAQEMLDAGVGGLNFNETQSGLKTDVPVDVYVYPNFDDMRAAILYEPSWTGGIAFPEHNIVLMGLSGGDTGWDQSTIVHELTHVLVGHLTFSCLGIVPTWLNEGLAVFSEGKLDSASAAQLEDAIKSDKLLSVESLSAGFSEVADKANLSYSESYSIVKFLIETYGQADMTGLLTSLRDGLSVDEALLKVYGFNINGLENKWRGAIGAPARQASAQPTAQPTPTFVPTIVPISGAQAGHPSTPFVVPTSSFGGGTPASPGSTSSGPPRSLTIALLAFCCVFGLLIGVIVLGVIVRGSARKAGKNG